MQTVFPLSFELNRRHAERVWENCLRKLLSVGFIGVGHFLGVGFFPLKSLLSYSPRTRASDCNVLGKWEFSGVAKRVVFQRVVLADLPPERKPERGYIRMFPQNENRNEGTFACSPRTKTGTRVHSPNPPFHATALLSPNGISLRPTLQRPTVQNFPIFFPDYMATAKCRFLNERDAIRTQVLASREGYKPRKVARDALLYLGDPKNHLRLLLIFGLISISLNDLSKIILRDPPKLPFKTSIEMTSRGYFFS